MVFLYATDLHGDVKKYNDILSFAIEKEIKIIHLGADLLPKGSSILTIQKKFVNEFLKEFYEKCKDNGIEVLAFFGNDDIYTRKKYFKKYGELLDENPKIIQDYEFSAYPYVCDYPFSLKTACKLDYRGWKRPNSSRAVDVDNWGIVDIIDIDYYFSMKSTIQEDLKNFSVSEKSIVACHMPPSNVCLDVCFNGLRVGSRSVLDWIKKNQPLVTLHGHIHESYQMTDTWKVYIGKTLVVQPGQSFKTRFVLFDIDSSSINCELIEV